MISSATAPLLIPQRGTGQAATQRQATEHRITSSDRRKPVLARIFAEKY